MRSSLSCFLLLLAVFNLEADSVPTDPYLTETPAHTSITRLATFGSQGFSNLDGVHGGAAIEVDSAGNYYQASGAKISKFNAGGVLQWSQSHHTHIDETQSGGQNQFRYFDEWTDDHDDFVHIQLGSGLDEGQRAGLYAQKIAIDGAGDVYVSFLDLLHRDRSVLGKFDGVTGVVEWVARSAAPHQAEPSFSFVSKAIDLVVLPDQSVALLESGIGWGRYTYSRLIIFASEGTHSQMGVKVVDLQGVHRNDGGAIQRMSVGVGLVVATDGSLIYATFEGDVPSPLPAYPAPYPAPNKLVIRKLAPPYTGTPIEVVHDAAGVEHWSDLAIGPGGTVYALGTVGVAQAGQSGNDLHPILAGFDPVTLAETRLPRKTYPPSTGFPFWRIPGIELLPTGTGAEDSLYLTTGTSDFREDPSLDFYFRSSSTGQAYDLGVTKVNSAGTVLWQKYELYQPVYDAFIDTSANLFLIGENVDYPGIAIIKYSSSGVLQLAKNVGSDDERDVEGRFTGAIDASGNIAVSFPQLLPGGEYFASPINLYANPPNIEVEAQTIDFPHFTSSIHVGERIYLDATSSSGLPVSFRITMGGSKAAISGNVLEGLAAGVVMVEAYQNGNGNIAAASPVSQLLAIYQKNQTIKFRTQSKRKLGKKGKAFSYSLKALTSSGLPVTFTSNNPKVIKVKGRTATVLKKGKATLTATQAGDHEFSAAIPVKIEVKVE